MALASCSSSTITKRTAPDQARDLGPLGQEALGQDEEVGVVHGGHGPLALGVAVGDRADELETVGEAGVLGDRELGRVGAGLDRPADDGGESGGGGQRGPLPQTGEHLVARGPHEVGLILAVEHREPRREPDTCPVPAKEPVRQGVEGPCHCAA
jgi:hypothetical protein